MLAESHDSAAEFPIRRFAAERGVASDDRLENGREIGIGR
jgi:hypothetical protein